MLLDATPAQESTRLAAVVSSGLLDRSVPDELEVVVRTAAQLTRSPMTALTVLDEDHQFVVSAVGFDPTVTDRSIAFCNHTIDRPDGMLVNDSLLDPRFTDNPLVTGSPHLRSYAGVPVRLHGQPLGALCLFSTQPDEFDERHLDLLRPLVSLAEQTLELGWRRDMAAPPSLATVEALAEQIAAGADVDDVVASVPRPALAFDRDTLQLIHVNDAAVERYGWERSDFIERTVLDLRPPKESETLGASIRESSAVSVQPYWNERPTLHWDSAGRSFPVALRLADFDLHGRSCRLAVVTDLSAHRALSTAVEHATNFDPLTALGNRRFLMSQLENVCASGGRATLMMIDLDHFKSVNDVAGHACGDELLVVAAVRIALDLPAGSIPTRSGGDAFVIIVPDVGPEESAAIAEDIRRRLHAPYLLSGGEFRLTASIGITSAESCLEPAELLGRVDDALADAKAQGRNRVSAAGSGTRKKHRNRSGLGLELTTALARDEMMLWYQPIVRLGGDGPMAVDQAEALVRWNHPTRGVLAPGAFLDVLGETGLMPRLNRHVLDHACRAVAELRAQGREVRVSVNCSAEQFNAALIHDIDAAVARHGVHHCDLRLEVTETAFAGNDSEVCALVMALAERSLPIEIDDFGAGHSSLSRLADLPVQALKLDGSFVAASSTSHGRRMLQAIFDLSRVTELPITAEGIENVEQLEIVTEIGFDMGQGYFFARPAALDELPRQIHLDR